MTKNLSPLLTVALSILLSAVGAPQAADQVIAVPNPWDLDPSTSPYALSPAGGAVGVHKTNSNPPPVYQETRVLQIVNGAIHFQTNFNGRVFRLDYSPDGSRLLVHEHESDTGQPWNMRRVHLLLHGDIQWTKDVEDVTFGFSTSGTAVYSVTDGPVNYGNRFSVFDLSGGLQSQTDFDQPMSGLVVLGGGDSAVVVLGGTVMRLDLTSKPATTAWQFDLESYDSSPYDLRALSDTRLIIRQSNGRFMVIDAVDGDVLYRYNPEYLGEIDGARTLNDYSGFEPFDDLTGLGSDEIFLFAAKKNGFMLNLTNATVTPSMLDGAEASAPCVGKNEIRHSKMMILCPDQIRIRPLSH